MTSGPQEPAGWFGDPTGRFGRRHWDGNRWTDYVATDDGTVVPDPLSHDHPLPPPQPAPPAAPPFAPPGYRAPTSPPPSGPPGYPPSGFPQPDHARPAHPPQGHQVAWASSAPSARARPGWGLAVGGVGIVLVLLSLFVVPWTDVDGTRFTDLGSAVRDAGRDGVGDVLLWGYPAWAAFVLLAVVAGLVAAAGVPLVRSSTARSVVGVAGAVTAGVATALHGYVLHEINPGRGDFSVGGWLGLVGFAVAGLGAVLGARTPVTATATYAPRGGSATAPRVVGGAVLALALVVAVGFAVTEGDGAATVAPTGEAGGSGATDDPDPGTSEPDAAPDPSPDPSPDPEPAPDPDAEPDPDPDDGVGPAGPAGLPTVERLTTSFPLPVGAVRGTARRDPPRTKDGWVQYFWRSELTDVAAVRDFYVRKLPEYGVVWNPVQIRKGGRGVGWGDDFPTDTSPFGGQLDIEQVSSGGGARVIEIRLQMEKP